MSLKLYRQERWSRRRLTLTIMGLLALVGMLMVSTIWPGNTAAKGKQRAIWVTADACGPRGEAAKHYYPGELVFLNGAGFAPGTYDWTIAAHRGHHGADPDRVVARGRVQTDATGTFCVTAYRVAPEDHGSYEVTVGREHAKYHVHAKRGTLWLTANDCGTRRDDAKHFRAGDLLFINGAKFYPGTYAWTITGHRGHHHEDPDQVVAQGNVQTDAAGAFCVAAYRIAADDHGHYHVRVGNASDKYDVKQHKPTKTPAPTKTRTPVPTCTPNPETDLWGKLLTKNQGKVVNSSAACSYLVGIASYRKLGEDSASQELFDWQQATIQPGETLYLNVRVPSCAAQIYLFYGEVLHSLRDQRYGTRLLDDMHAWCGCPCETRTPTTQPSATKTKTARPTETTTTTPTQRPTEAATATPSPSPTPSATMTPSPSPTLTLTPSPSLAPSPTALSSAGAER